MVDPIHGPKSDGGQDLVLPKLAGMPIIVDPNQTQTCGDQIMKWLGEEGLSERVKLVSLGELDSIASAPGQLFVIRYSADHSSALNAFIQRVQSAGGIVTLLLAGATEWEAAPSVQQNINWLARPDSRKASVVFKVKQVLDSQSH